MRFPTNRKLIAGLVTAILALTLSVGAVVTAADQKDSMFQRIRTVFNMVESWHKDGANLDKFVEGAIRGGLEALGDPYTNYYAPKDYQGFLDSLNGSFSGIGAYLEQDGKYVVISAPIKNTPASRAGLKSGDRILEAEGVSLVNANTERAVQLIRGPAGTAVTLKIERPSESRTFTVSITRAVINIPEVEYKMLDGKIGYIQLASFGDDVVQDFYKAADDLKAQGAKGLVLDLRQNPGGYLDAAVSIAGAFVPRDQVVVWETAKGEKTARRSPGRLINLPAAVLVDKGSASASEILAGAIQDYGAAELVGTKTFGKGTVQQIVSLGADGGMKVTIAEYLTPKERKVHGIGLTPDVELENPTPSDERTKPMELKRMLSISMVGLDVLYLQYRLEDLGYTTETDGFFGWRTEAAVRQFSRDNFIPETTTVDKAFVDELNKQVAERLSKAKEDDAQLAKAVELVNAKLK